MVALIAGCGSSPHRAPVQDLSVAVPAGSSVNPATLPGAENAGKPGYYAVQPGDTIMRIAASTSQNWRDIVRWNNLENPNAIEVGQVLRIVPPVNAPVAVATQTTPDAGNRSAMVSPTPAARAVAAPVPAGAEKVDFMWPAKGAVLTGFDEARNKGLNIGGKAGDSVYAAADGRVVYAGSGLRGYGNLIIIKHNNTFLTAYAHNQTILVKEDQNIKKGQKIAEMGSTDASRVQLHFEIRRSGTPVDPAQYLPSR